MSERVYPLGETDYRGNTSRVAPITPRPEPTCQRCGSSLIGRLERRYLRAQTRWPFATLEVEVFLCPCRNGTRRIITRPVEEGAAIE